MTIRWVYLDESEFILNGLEYIAYGALITEEQITQEYTDEALNALQKFKEDDDKDFNRQDERTLQRQYFHACDDSCCGHTAICRQIENINGAILLNCIPKSNDVDINWLSMLSSSIGLYHSGYTALIYEQRPELTSKKIEELYKNYDSQLIQSYADLLWTPVYFPEPGYKIVNKSEPGVQFIDFILWAYQRHLNDDSRWHNRVVQNAMMSKGCVHFQSQYADNKTTDDFFFECCLNHGLKDNDTNYREEYNELLSNKDKEFLNKNKYDEITDENIKNSLLLINSVMSKIIYNKEPERYFESQIKYAIENKLTNLENFLVVFLKIFDNFELIKNVDDELKCHLLIARKIVALSFYYGYSDRLRLQQELITTWQELANKNFV